jgi:hypothetical protein
VTDPDEHDVALADPDLLILLGCESSATVTWSPGSSQDTPRERGTSSSTPRPTMPSAARPMDSSAAPAAVTVAAVTPLYSLPSKITWQRASTWLSALPWMFIAIRSMLNASP